MLRPDKIFFDEFFSFTTSLGSLMYLGEENISEIDNSRFIVTSFTEAYSSPEYIEAVKN